MPPIKRTLLNAIFAVALASATTFAFALPGPTACLLVGVAELHKLSDGSLTDSESEVDQRRYVQLTRDARARIEGTFGAIESKPILVFFSHPDGFGPFSLNAYGSTQFIGSRACVMVGPKGQSVDVVAHELMHAEIHHRVGYLKRFLQLPTWFDEGVAMQVDYRTRYSLSPQDAQNADYVRGLETFSSFFKGDDQAVVRNYASAKQVVASWLSKVGTTSLYSRLQRMKNGESFAEIVTEWELANASRRPHKSYAFGFPPRCALRRRLNLNVSVTSRVIVWTFDKQIGMKSVPVLHGLGGRGRGGDRLGGHGVVGLSANADCLLSLALIVAGIAGLKLATPA